MSAFLIVGLMAFALIWMSRRQQKATEGLLEAQAQAFREVQLRQIETIDKAFAQLRSSDPWQYQSIMAMQNPASVYDEVYDPSDEAEIRRIADRNGKAQEYEEALDGEAAEILSDLFPGS